MKRMTKSEKKEALNLMLTTDLSWRKIAAKLGIPKSTVCDYLRKYKNNPEYMKEILDKESGPKIFLFDVETSTILAHVFGLFNQNISLSAIQDDWYTICFSGKMVGGEVFNHSVHNFELPESGEYKDNERYIVEALWKYLDDCDVAVAYNGKKFDKKKMNWKFFEYGLPEPSPYKLIDPYQIVKGNFSPTSGKMDYIAKYCDDINNSKHKTDMSLWVACRNNDVQSLDYMSSYCDQDIELLEKVWLAVRHWDKNSPQLSLYYPDNKKRCSSCGSSHLTLLENKNSYTSLSKFELYRCGNCSKIMRGRENIVPTDKRKNLLMNAR